MVVVKCAACGTSNELPDGTVPIGLRFCGCKRCMLCGEDDDACYCPWDLEEAPDARS